MRPKSIGWLHSERAQASEFVDSLDLMVVLLHTIWLPQRLWLSNSIETGRWRRPTLCGVRIVLVVIDVGIGWISVGVIVVVLFEVGIGMVRRVVACVLGALDSHDWLTHDSSFGAFGSPPHDGSLLEVFSFLEVFGSPPHDNWFLEVFGLPVHELSTHG